MVGIDQTHLADVAARWAMHNLVRRQLDTVIFIHCRPVLTSAATYASLGQAYLELSGMRAACCYLSLSPRSGPSVAHRISHATTRTPPHPRPPVFEELELNLKLRSKALLRARAQPWKNRGYAIRCISIASNTPGTELVHRAGQLGADVVVVGSGRKTLLDR